MNVSHQEMIGRAVAWGESTDEVAGLLLYGSVAQGRGRQLSDLDMVVVTRTGKDILRSPLADPIRRAVLSPT